MNIEQAKQQIKNAMTAYFTKDEFGGYVIPPRQQRPVFLLGPPGLGKTAIMEQIAAELGVGLVSYSMTHRTRQSALGLPFIVKKSYGGQEYSVSEYTMSEIIASVYDLIEETGFQEGILFLDEVNCVSETLAPSMLQFLQYKIFGRHRLPDGWIVVTAGNPPEYNHSVREFDTATWDRLKRIDIEPDFEAWKKYALQGNVHPAILSYLEIKTGDFYRIETTVDGKQFVTARGWSDLSDMMRLYEKHGIKVDEPCISQYLQNPKIAKEFAIYYSLFDKYKSDYKIDQILSGKADDALKDRAKTAKFDERLAVLGLLLDKISGETQIVCVYEDGLRLLMNEWKAAQQEILQSGPDPLPVLAKHRKSLHRQYEKKQRAAAISKDERQAYEYTLKAMENQERQFALSPPTTGEQAWDILKRDFNKRTQEMKKLAETTGQRLSNLFSFCGAVFGQGHEMLILVSELTVSRSCARIISRYGCKEYFAHNKELGFSARQKEILARVEALGTPGNDIGAAENKLE